VRSIVAALAGDWEAARRVELELPATGVCGGADELCCNQPVDTPGTRVGTVRLNRSRSVLSCGGTSTADESSCC